MFEEWNEPKGLGRCEGYLDTCLPACLLKLDTVCRIIETPQGGWSSCFAALGMEATEGQSRGGPAWMKDEEMDGEEGRREAAGY